MEYRILGPLEVEREGSLVPLGGTQQRAILAILLLQRGKAVTTDRLIDELWDDQPPPTAAKTIQVYVSRLRKTLGDGAIVSTAGGYAVPLEEGSLDLDRFERLVAGGQALLQDDPTSAAQQLESALALWRGPALGDLAYLPFAQRDATRLEELRLSAIEGRIEADLALDRHSELIAELEALVGEHPLRERLCSQLMLALYRSGRQAEALAAYQSTRSALVRELGLEPGPELQELHHKILNHDPSLAPPPPRRADQRHRRGPLLIAAGGAVLVAAAIAIAAAELAGSGGSGAITQLAPDSIGVIDPSRNELVAEIPAGSNPAAVAVERGAVWVVDAGDRTLLRVDPATRQVISTVGLAAVPTGIAVGGGAVWIANGGGSFGTVSRFEPLSESVTRTIVVHATDRGDAFAPPTPSAITSGGGAVWTNNLRDRISRIPTVAAQAATLELGADHSADGIAVGAGAVWVTSSADDKVLRVNPRALKVTASIPIAARPGERIAGPYGVAVGDGAVWVADSLSDSVSRIDPVLNAVVATISVGRRPTHVAVDQRAIWVLNAGAGTVSRIDPHSNTVVATIPVGPAATGIAAGDGGVWITVAGGPAALRASAPVALQPLPRSSCGGVLYDGIGQPQFLIASDLPRYVDGRPSSTTAQAQQAITYLLRTRGFRAGQYRVGYQACDDSTQAEGTSDPSRCATNARAYAKDQSLLGIIGTYHSYCAMIELPVLNAAPGGPLALISPANTYVGLTHSGPGTLADEPDRYYPTGVRNYGRLLASDDYQGAADAVLARQLGIKHLYVLDDGNGTGYADSQYVANAGLRLGISTAGHASWNRNAKGYLDLAERVRRSGADGVFIAGCICSHGIRLLRDLRVRLGPAVKFIAADAFLDAAIPLGAAGRASAGLYVSVAGPPVTRLPASGKRFVSRLRQVRRIRGAIDPIAVYSAQAAEILLAAIADSDGTRASVVNHFRTIAVRDGLLGVPPT